MVGNFPSNKPNVIPPSFTPSKAYAVNNIMVNAFKYNASALKPLMLKPLYIWLRDDSEFWAWITFIYGNHIGGFMWNNNSWINFEADLRKIEGYF